MIVIVRPTDVRIVRALRRYTGDTKSRAIQRTNWQHVNCAAFELAVEKTRLLICVTNDAATIDRADYLVTSFANCASAYEEYAAKEIRILAIKTEFRNLTLREQRREIRRELTEVFLQEFASKQQTYQQLLPTFTDRLRSKELALSNVV